MPYIQTELRKRFNPHIRELVSLIVSGAEGLPVKGEYFGHFTNRLLKGYMCAQDIENNAFNANFFPAEKRRQLREVTDRLISQTNKGDPIEGAGDLNYIITAVLWGICGDAKDVPPARYGFRAFLKGVCHQVEDQIKDSKFTNMERRDLMLCARRYSARGVLSDVIDETYRRKTSVYENEKMKEAGDIWQKGGLSGTE